MLDKLELLPHKIKFMYDMIQINDKYISFWTIKKYLSEIKILNGIEKILNIPNTYVSMNINKLDSYEYLKKLNYVINNIKSEKKSFSSDQIDTDILEKMTNDAQQLRYLIQVENQEIYQVSIYISIYEDNEKTLAHKIKSLENTCFANGFYIVPANFKQKEIYELALPIRNQNEKISDLTHSIFTTSSLTNIFPFYINSLINEQGIYIGNSNNFPCFIDFMNISNNNKNMLVLGSSGAGKSYFIKHMLLQYLCKGIKQIVIDPEGEYIEIAKKLGQRIIDRNNFNILEINESFVKKYPISFIDEKINNIIEIFEIEKYIENREKIIEIKDYLRYIYKKFNIEQDISCMYKNSNMDTIFSDKKFLSQIDFPTVQDLIQNIDKIKLNKNQKKNIIDKLYEWNCNYNSFKEYDNKIIVYDVRNIEKGDKYVEAILRQIKEHIETNLIIYADEMWKLIAFEKGRNVSVLISDMFKTIRKQGAGIVGITQDISDVLNYDKGNFGKSILNNSFTKVYFRMEYIDIENLQQFIPDYNKFAAKVKRIEKGTSLIDYGGNMFEVQIIANEFENKIIEGEI